MVDGKLYYDTGKESTISGRCGVMDGEITSTVDGSEIPTKDNQSNEQVKDTGRLLGVVRQYLHQPPGLRIHGGQPHHLS